MNMIRYAALMVLTAGLMTGCVSVKYEGQSYAPTAGVKLFEDRTLIPEDYVEIGRCVAYARYDSTLSKADICEKVRVKAESVGADAVHIYAHQVVPESIVTGSIEQVWNDGTSDTMWSRMERDFASYGQIGKDTTSPHAHSSYMRVIRAAFLKSPENLTEPVGTVSGNLEKVGLDPQAKAAPSVEAAPAEDEELKPLESAPAEAEKPAEVVTE